MTKKMKRAQIVAECPYFKRLGDKGVVCEGLTARGSVLIGLGSRAARDGWVRTYCARYASAGVRCPMAETFDEIHGVPDPGSKEAALRTRRAETGGDASPGALRSSAIKIVTNEKRTKAFLSGETQSLTMPDAKIYRHLFRRIPKDGGSCLVELITAGQNAGPVMTVFVRRRRSDGVTEPYGRQVWEISRTAPEG